MRIGVKVCRAIIGIPPSATLTLAAQQVNDLVQQVPRRAKKGEESPKGIR